MSEDTISISLSPVYMKEILSSPPHGHSDLTLKYKPESDARKDRVRPGTEFLKAIHWPLPM